MWPDYAALSTDPRELPGLVTPEAPPIATTALEVVGGDVPIVDTGEPLVEVRDHQIVNAYRATSWPGTTEAVWLRRQVAERLDVAASALPPGFGLAIYDGWRSEQTIRALHDHYYGPGSTLAPGFLADPDDPDVVPPHLTGGAVDLTLSWRGTALSLGTPFDDFSSRAHLRSLEDEPGDEPSRSLRRLLHAVMVDAGFAPFGMEWWHYSWGDQAWACASVQPVASYGPTAP